MKTLFKTTLVLFTIVSIVACKNDGKNQTHNNDSEQLSFNNNSVEQQFQQYIHLKTALVNSDIAEAKSGAKMLMEHTEDSSLKNLLSNISEAQDIEAVRTIFSDVTEQMTKIVEQSISSGEVYKQYCPMAFNNQGGYWLSNKEEIRNPYFGDRMLKCGKVAETIK